MGCRVQELRPGRTVWCWRVPSITWGERILSSHRFVICVTQRQVGAGRPETAPFCLVVSGNHAKDGELFDRRKFAGFAHHFEGIVGDL